MPTPARLVLWLIRPPRPRPLFTQAITAAVREGVRPYRRISTEQFGAPHYLINVFIALDFLLNSLLAGDPSETLTHRAARARREGRRWGCVLCWLLEQVDHGHCRRFG